MSQSHRSKIDSLLDNHADISSPSNNRSVTSHDGASYVRTLIVILLNGSERIFHYSYLVDAKFDRESGAISLNFTSASIVLSGVRLHSLFHSFSKHEPSIVTEVDTRYESLSNDKEPVITTIEIVDK